MLNTSRSSRKLIHCSCLWTSEVLSQAVNVKTSELGKSDLKRAI